MKTILIVRHAKSSWDNFSISDLERPLNNRGKKNAPEMARRLLKKKIAIDAFLSSPALRARTTAELFAEEFGTDKNKIIIIPALYMADRESFSESIRNAPAGTQTIALFSHNPGITEFVNSLTNIKVDDMPTCGIFALTTSIGDWLDFEGAEKSFYFFEYPKLHS